MVDNALIKTAEAGADLVTLVSKAARMLDKAKSSAEVLEAKALADLAYDAAQRASRLAKAQRAHHDITDAARRMQADSLRITARAQMRLADEIDAAQERGEVQTVGPPKTIVSTGNDCFDSNSGIGSSQNLNPIAGKVPTIEDIGITRKELHIARKMRDREKEEPGIIDRSIEAVFETDAPSKAAVLRQVMNEPLPPKPKAGFKNPDYVKNESRDRALAFSGACEDLVEAAGKIDDILPHFEHWHIPRIEAAIPVIEEVLANLREARPELFKGAAA